ncbi:MAG TPA: hypothetical protein ENO08_00220 [Candidatus Eisenbacteria bacterium]|uniref:DUF1571 domain-containing protein n=1 Tax=Eiseniibacteriota bacterium TaxID=2212470 RepID=A0A7V2ATB2_UNCEI|nr:hypothetical protein [Candidatus Eisenbacteria bacterium]
MNGTRIGMICVTLALAAILALPSTAVNAAPGGSEEAKELLLASVEATGGMEAATGWTTMVQTGILRQFQPGWGNLTADCSRHVVKPDKVRDERDFSAYDHPFFYQYYLNGDDAWMLVNMMVREHPRVTETMKELMRLIDGVAYYAAHTDSLFLVPDVPDDSLFTGSSIDRVGVVDRGDTVFIDLCRETRYPVRRIDDGGARLAIYSIYREADGRTVPFRVQIFEQTGVTTEYLWDEIRYDVEIDEEIFEEFRPVKEE